MIPINSLLNNEIEPERSHRVSTLQKRPRMAKDAPIFRPGKIQGECRYPPHEDRDEELVRLHEEFKMKPIGSIAKFPRHIPYASDKKTFQEKTGRDSFHVFQYTFKLPSEEREWAVMWDYNIGIVRITHLFKCNGYSKATKMLNVNPGLREICHSITGGALSAQGYWMPFEAAKALAVTFCWNIRYALTPLFGNDFPAMCIHPNDRKNFGRMVVPPGVIRRATETAMHYRSLEACNNIVHPLTPPNRHLPSMTHHLLHGPERLIRKIESDGDDTLSLRFPPPKIPRHNYADSVANVSSARDSSLEAYCNSPKSATSLSSFTPINPPRSHTIPFLQPKNIIAAISNTMRPDQVAEGISDESDTGSEGSSNMYSTPNCPSMDEMMDIQRPGEVDGMPSDMDTRLSDSDDLTDSDEEWAEDDADDEDYRGPAAKREDGASPNTKSVSRTSKLKNPSRKSRALRPRSSPHFYHEVKAAEALLHLHKNELETSELDTEIEDVSSSFSFVTQNGPKNDRKRRRASY
ncbi:hypothetical protein PENANT_c065G03618 [Penicillium antarcticum]|uniref:HTH APSES-type domain-containing protein n=1 Tax=Penicillium antarcticum TaxID=416450 RepID=A0A1V6PPV6_9EURO|nr:hypothetical protein PENANT_c065G03618 [Penicillium antarcticum]